MAPITTSGAISPPVRDAARNCVVFQRPCGALAVRRISLSERPLDRVRLVLAQVPSRKPRGWERARSGNSPGRATFSDVGAVLLGRRSGLLS